MSQIRHVRAFAAWSTAMALLAIIACGAPVDANATGEISSYRLAPGDRIAVTVIGQKDLSGNFPVDLAGIIILPIVGPVKVGNLTIAECQERIAKRLADGIINKPSVFVTIAEVQPIHILGDVKAPGRYPYRHGTLVKSIIAQAGGFGLVRENRTAAVSEFLLADERVQVLSAKRRRLLIRHARLEAQLDGAKTFTPEALRGPTNDQQTTKLIAEERRALALQTDALQRQVNLIQSLKPQLSSESESLDRLIASEKKQVDLVQKQINEYDKLVRKGLGRFNAAIELKLALESKQSNIWRLNADRSRVQINIAELKIRVQNDEAIYKKQVLIELLGVRERLNDVAVTLPSACEVREAKLLLIGRSIGAAPLHDIKITRLRNTNVSTFQATGTTLLEPGDIVEVRMLRRSGSRSRMTLDKREALDVRNTNWCLTAIEKAEPLTPRLKPAISGKS